ncbi:MTH1187 family thiamine-binding protein [Paenibacillus lutrae]|uniref:MTH1187 family thiamine-binding protein n=1 Tax=Paenibacillus lutrae TaxID=2078573 RepID=A0A7X3K0M3_9BACL|nr:MTH1187 family thiamine-binding protein [Paenibacillus lutrae]MVP01225.1 MTH1187 family thiamine-binding protein [Paenibacillus lutrae]
MAIVEITVVPIGTASTSLSEYVAHLQKVLDNQPLHYELTPMSTIIEGPLDQVMDVVLRLHESPFENGAMRVSTSIKIDDRRDKQASMEQKLQSVADKLGRI